MATSTLQLSLADVARLAGVARPVVTVWRSRPLAHHPFPEPVARVGGSDRFDAFEVAEYLAATGRGNNTVERADVAAHAHLARIPGMDNDAVFAGLTALLVLGAEVGEPLAELPEAKLVERAREADPGDEMLLREIAGLGDHLPDLAAHADALADASYSARAAFEALLQQQRSRGLLGQSTAELRPEANALVGRLAAELAADAGWEAPLFVGPVPGVGDLLLQAAGQHAGGLTPSVAVTPDDSKIGRLRRRRLRVHDLHQVALELSASGDLVLPSAPSDGSVHVMQLPPWDRHGDGDAAILDAVGDLLVQLAQDSRVVVISTASALTDKPTSADADRSRDAVLRSGRLRAAIRLPAGLAVRAPRQHLALWVLGPAHEAVPTADRWTVVGDLSQTKLDEQAIEDLVTDVVASMADQRQADTHAYRFSHRVVTARLIPGRLPLVDLRSPVVSTGRGTRTLDDLVARGECRLVPGHRIDPGDLRPDGRRVIGAEELTGALAPGSRAVDPLTFPTTYPSSRYTEAGDVVFCTSPRPAAVVDHEGGSVVLAPARVLRIVTDPDQGPPDLMPHVIAADINRAPGSDWRRWRLRLVPRGRHAELHRELARIEAERRHLQDRLTHLDHQAKQAMDHAAASREEGR